MSRIRRQQQHIQCVSLVMRHKLNGEIYNYLASWDSDKDLDKQGAVAAAVTIMQSEMMDEGKNPEQWELCSPARYCSWSIT